MNQKTRLTWLLATIIAIVSYAVGPRDAFAEAGCRTGAVAAGNAFVRFNPIYAMYFGDLETYVAENRGHFSAGGDSVRCMAALSRAFMSAAIQLYDPADVQRKQVIDARLGAMGISPGPQQPSASTMMYMMSMQLGRLARDLPAAANGDFTALNTPSNEIERMQQAAIGVLSMMMRDPTVREMFVAMEPLMREAAQLDYTIVVKAAERLANSK